MKLVVDLIRGKLYSEARTILEYTNKRAAQPLFKLLESARANAERKAEAENIAVDVDELWVKECFVGKGVTKHRRRMRPAPMGRAYRERRHYSHITIRLSSEKRAKAEPPKATQAKAAPAETKPAETVEAPPASEAPAE
jgi:large subunit ribosomal protein L22